jgi:4-hydroxybenzoate polyprenyltransferase
MPASAHLPLCTDLDGTLIRTDTLYESFFLLVKRSPRCIFLLPLWLFFGKAYLKQQLAERVLPNPALLPYNETFLEFLRAEHRSGRPLVLVSAANQKIVDAVAGHLRIFSSAIGSSVTMNCSGKEKARVLCQAFDEKGFVYAGNARSDMPVWHAAAEAIVVHPQPSLRLYRIPRVARVFSNEWSIFRKCKTIVRCLRVKQWSKNILVFIPIVFAYRISEINLLTSTFIAFFAFSFVASSTYILNDILDLEHDRLHTTKRRRPFAAGTLSLGTGALLFFVCIGGATILSRFLPAAFQAMLVGYFVMTLLYSFWLKRLLIVDVMVLASFYALRMYAGALATGVPISSWLLGLSVFLFLSIAFAKRYVELRQQPDLASMEAGARGYRPDDAEHIARFGVASGYAAVLVLMLYVSNEHASTLYLQSELLWGLFPLALFWITRFWMNVVRLSIREDPTDALLGDPMTYAIGLLIVAVLFFARTGLVHL